MRVLVFGDSNTQGFWDTEGGWVQRLRKHFDEITIKNLDKYDSQPTIFNLGISGDTTRNLLARIEFETKVRKWPNDPQTVIVAIGINDSLFEDGEQLVPEKEFRANLKEIITTLKLCAEKVIFVGCVAVDEKRTTPVSWADDIFYTDKEVEKYEQITGFIAEKEEVPFVPIFDRFKSEQEKQNLLEDGLHPNNEGHKLIASLVLPELEKLLN